MIAAILKSQGSLEVGEAATPQCPKGGVLLRVEACAVCGTDTKMLNFGHRDLQYPRILGHEVVGRIEVIEETEGTEEAVETAKTAAKADGYAIPKEGDLCQVWPGIACQECPSCLRGSDNRCREMKIVGFNYDGGFAEYMALPGTCLAGGINLLPDDVDPAHFTLAEPLGCCINGQEQARVSEGDTLLIYGGGPIGALHALLAELRGAEKILVAEKLPGRIRLIERHTTAQVFDLSEDSDLQRAILNETNGRGVDVILTATPEISVDHRQMRLLAPGGRICIFSGPRTGNWYEQIDLRSMHYLEHTITGSYGCSSRQNREAVRLLRAGSIDAGWIITKRTDLTEISDAFDHSSRRLGMKSVVCQA